MAKYAIMNRSFSSYYHSGGDSEVATYYDSIHQYVTRKGSSMFEAVLVSLKPVKTGFSIIVDYSWTRRWKPVLEWKWERRIVWLGLCIQITATYRDMPDHIVKDHCEDLRRSELQ